MTTPFCERHKRLMKQALPNALKIDILILEETGTLLEYVEVSTTNYQRICPYGYVYRMFFQAQMNVGVEPRKLIFGETDYSFSLEHSVPALFPSNLI